MKCKKGYEIKALKSAAGWYMGTVDEKGFPNCRLTNDYAKTGFKALELPLTRQVGCIENEFCNGGTGCFSS